MRKFFSMVILKNTLIVLSIHNFSSTALGYVFPARIHKIRNKYVRQTIFKRIFFFFCLILLNIFIILRIRDFSCNVLGYAFLACIRKIICRTIFKKTFFCTILSKYFDECEHTHFVLSCVEIMLFQLVETK